MRKARWDDLDAKKPQEADEKHRRQQAWRRYLQDRGRRYEHCRFDNFRSENNTPAATVSEQCQRFADNARYHLELGEGLVLFGPRGTGKDHLLTAAIHRVTKYFGIEVVWMNGCDIFSEARRRIETNTVGALCKDLVRAEVLAISDPLPPSGTLTEWQQELLFSVVDGRYSEMRPTWLTINVATRAELDERLGAAISDRLVDGATALYCAWPSYRRSRNQRHDGEGG